MTTLDDRAPDDPANPYVGIFDGFLDDGAEPAQPSGPDERTFDRHRVTAVLVSHDGARWLPYALTALRRAARAPQRLIAVDTGSHRRPSSSLLQDELGRRRASSASPGTPASALPCAHAVDALRGAPGPARRRRRTTGPSSSGCGCCTTTAPPSPRRCAGCSPSSTPARRSASPGPKVRGWHDSSRLLEVGVSISGGGRRETGLDRGELDQGQHDGRRDVLAVGTAGMLVRRDVLGPARRLRRRRCPLFRDDVDFGWRANLAGHRVVVVPEAVVHHVEAAGHGRRRPLAPGMRQRAPRRPALGDPRAAGRLPWPGRAALALGAPAGRHRAAHARPAARQGTDRGLGRADRRPAGAVRTAGPRQGPTGPPPGPAGAGPAGPAPPAHLDGRGPARGRRGRRAAVGPGRPVRDHRQRTGVRADQRRLRGPRRRAQPGAHRAVPTRRAGGPRTGPAGTRHLPRPAVRRRPAAGRRAAAGPGRRHRPVARVRGRLARRRGGQCDRCAGVPRPDGAAVEPAARQGVAGR